MIIWRTLPSPHLTGTLNWYMYTQCGLVGIRLGIPLANFQSSSICRLHVFNFHIAILACVFDNIFIIFSHRSLRMFRFFHFSKVLFSVFFFRFTKVTGPPFAGGVPLQALVFSNSLFMHRALYQLSPSTFPLLSSRSSRKRRKPFQIALRKVRTTRYQNSFSSILHCFWTAFLTQLKLPNLHINLELHSNNSGTNTNTIPPEINLYHSEIPTVHEDPRDQSASALLGNPLYI